MAVIPSAGAPDVHEPFICVVAGGNHVMVMVDAAETDGAFDVIEGTLTFAEARDGEVVAVPPPCGAALYTWLSSP